MPQPGQTAIILYHSNTAGHTPSAGNMNVGELAITIPDRKWYTLDPTDSLVVLKIIGSLSAQDADAVAITGGTVNGTIIGGSTPAAGTFTAGAFTTLSASSTVSGAGITALFASPPAIGSTAASTGAFTTLSASSTVSGTGITALFASPPAIGGTAAAAGAFTTLSASSTVSGAGFSTYLTAQLASPSPIGSVTPNTGAFTTLSATSTVSGAGITSLFASPPAIGGTVAAAGAFTTLSASNTVSGTGFSTYLASPPAIGGVTPSTGKFTSVIFNDATIQTTAANASSTIPASIASTAVIGTGTTWAHSDHVHDGVLSLTTSGSGISVTANKGAITISNTSNVYDGMNFQLFTTNSTYTVPAGITKIKVTLKGRNFGGEGDQIGKAGIKWISSLTPLSTIAVSVNISTVAFGSYMTCVDSATSVTGATLQIGDTAYGSSTLNVEGFVLVEW